MPDRHDAALRAALAERDRLVYPANEAVADWVIESIVEAALAAADAHDEGPCRTCGGQGWITVAEHGCDGNEELCDELCPVPAQAQCPECAQEAESGGTEPW